MAFFNPFQFDTLNRSTFASIENGFSSRYHAVIKEDFISAEEFLTSQDCKELGLEDDYRRYVATLGNALLAEVPIVFYYEPSNLTRSVFVSKINPNTGELLKESKAFIGLKGGLAGSGTPHYTFDQIHLDFATERIKAQNSAGINLNL